LNSWCGHFLPASLTKAPPVAVQALVIKLQSAEPEQLRQDLIAAVNTAMNKGWVLLLFII
jgi:hypothetical protein